MGLGLGRKPHKIKMILKNLKNRLRIGVAALIKEIQNNVEGYLTNSTLILKSNAKYL